MKLIQKPNTPLLIALSGFLVSKFTPGVYHKFGSTIYLIAISIWAYLEITSGVNLFRKILGGTVLLLTAYSLFIQLK